MKLLATVGALGICALAIVTPTGAQTHRPVDPNKPGYFLTLTINGVPGCTARPVHKVDNYANANCRVRGELDVHKPGLPVIPLGPDGRGRFTSAAFSIVATWGGLPQGEWYVKINHGNYTTTCTSSPCTLQIPNQTWDGNYVGRHNANAGVGWKEGTRGSPASEGWPTGLGAEVGVDYMRR